MGNQSHLEKNMVGGDTLKFREIACPQHFHNKYLSSRLLLVGQKSNFSDRFKL